MNDMNDNIILLIFIKCLDKTLFVLIISSNTFYLKKNFIFWNIFLNYINIFYCIKQNSSSYGLVKIFTMKFNYFCNCFIVFVLNGYERNIF